MGIINVFYRTVSWQSCAPINRYWRVSGTIKYIQYHIRTRIHYKFFEK